MINQFFRKTFFRIIKDKREILTNEERKILFSIINDNHENLTDEELYTFVQYIAQMPEKGLSVFQVEKGYKKLADKILLEHVGEFEMDYCPNDFISETSSIPQYYGKFEIENLDDFIFSLVKNGIKIINIRFYDSL